MQSLKQRSLPLPRSERKVLAMIDAEWLRENCLAFRGATEQIQWGYDLVFKVGEKMYAVAPMEPAPVCLSFKCSDESFAELTERPGIIPAPHLASAKWVALQTPDAISRNELGELLRSSYDLVFATLPKSVQAKLTNSAGSQKLPPRRTQRKKGKSTRSRR
jgi:predicted DNA-binding protein (MmcQ/YjbR family)